MPVSVEADIRTSISYTFTVPITVFRVPRIVDLRDLLPRRSMGLAGRAGPGIQEFCSPRSGMIPSSKDDTLCVGSPAMLDTRVECRNDAVQRPTAASIQLLLCKYT